MLAFVLRATLGVWAWARAALLPTPAKFHYHFSLSDLARVFQGIMRVPVAALADEGLLLKVRPRGAGVAASATLRSARGRE
jgi:hypothetical protein